MNSMSVLKQLIEQLQEYEQNSGDPNNLTLAGFYAHASPKPNPGQLQNTYITDKALSEADKSQSIETNIERVIAQHILFMYRYIKFYSRLAFSGTRINTIEEFGMMITVMQFGQITKTELIKRNIIEKSSGIEIINRLIKNGLLQQQHNPEDQRSQLIILTEDGRAELFRSFGKMDTLGRIAAGDLSPDEKDQLAIMLKKLDSFHYDNYNNKEIRKLEDYLPGTTQP